MVKRWKQGDIDTMSWIILLAGAAAIVFYVALMTWLPPAYGFADKHEEAAAFECQQLTYDLYVNGEEIAFGRDMTEQECVAVAKKMDEQTPPFTPIQCKKRYVCRQEL